MPGILIKTRFCLCPLYRLARSPLAPQKKVVATVIPAFALPQLNGSCCRAWLPKCHASSAHPPGWPIPHRAALENFYACHVQHVQLCRTRPSPPAAAPLLLLSSSFLSWVSCSLKATNPAQCTCSCSTEMKNQVEQLIMAEVWLTANQGCKWINRH